jgi:hypothetical protein
VEELDIMSEPLPYWLIHEPGKQHGFAIVSGDQADCEEDALAVWRGSEEVARWLQAGVDYTTLDAEARLITERLNPSGAR